MISELSFNSPIFILFSLHCLIGAIAAIVAQSKGYSLEKWLLFGLFGGTITLIIAITKPPQESKGKQS